LGHPASNVRGGIFFLFFPIYQAEFKHNLRLCGLISPVSSDFNFANPSTDHGIYRMFRPGIYWDPRVPQGTGLDQAQSQPQRARDEPAGRPRGAPANQQSAQGRLQQRQQQQTAEDLVDANGDDGFLPPVSMMVKARIVLDVAKVSCKQSFNNHSNCLIPQASYTFPLPAGCTVV
jgi:hypothetical protein